MTQPSNLSLKGLADWAETPSGQGVHPAGQAINADKLDGYHADEIIAAAADAGAGGVMAHGTANFTGNGGGTTIDFSPNLPNTDYTVIITPVAATASRVGEWWVIKSTGSFIVYNAGSATTSFDWGIAKQGALPVPAAPGTLGGSFSASDGAYGDRVRVSWTTVDMATAYMVYRSTSSDPATAAAVSGTLDGSATSFDDTTAVPGTTYYYWAKAGNSGGWSAFSPSDSGYAMAAPVMPGGTVLTAVTGSSGAIGLSWTVVPNATSYKILRAGVQIASGITGTSYTSSGMSPVTEYCHTIKASNAMGDSAESNSACAVAGGSLNIASSTTWVCPTGVTSIRLSMWGGGGGGGGGSTYGAPEVCTNQSHGTAGGTSSGFGVTAYGGGGGRTQLLAYYSQCTGDPYNSAAYQGGVGGSGGSASGADIVFSGGNGGNGGNGDNTAGGGTITRSYANAGASSYSVGGSAGSGLSAGGGGGGSYGVGGPGGAVGVTSSSPGAAGVSGGGGGGGGGWTSTPVIGCTAPGGGGGGGAGGCALQLITVTPGQSYPIVIGSRGIAGGVSNPADGGGGGAIISLP